jgi:carbon-monoxide dehydrogenase small subunit
MKTISLTVNGQRVEAAVEPRTHLADFLREHCRLTGTHLGCEHGVCGACTVLIDGAIARACITFAVACDGTDIRTVEGFADDELMRRLRAAFTREHGLQCGFCTPGMLITARDIIRRLGAIDEARLRSELSGNLCRCTGYAGIVNAVLAAMRELPPGIAPARGAMPVVAVAAVTPSAPLPEPVPAPAGAMRPAARAAASAGGGTVLTESFSLPHAAEQVWSIMQDLPLVASCLPGAELVDYRGGDKVRGRVGVKIGPINAVFAGDAEVTREPAERRAVIRGGGRDQRSGSRANGTLAYAVTAVPEGGSKVDVRLEFALSGPLAQFSRSGLVKAFVSRLVGTFAENLRHRLEPGLGAAPAPARLDLGALVWAALRDRIKAVLARLFGRRAA